MKIGDFVSLGSSNAVGRVVAFDADRITLDNSPYDVPMTAAYRELPVPSLVDVAAILDDVRRRYGPMPEPVRPFAGLSLMLGENDAGGPPLVRDRAAERILAARTTAREVAMRQEQAAPPRGSLIAIPPDDLDAALRARFGANSDIVRKNQIVFPTQTEPRVDAVRSRAAGLDLGDA